MLGLVEAHSVFAGTIINLSYPSLGGISLDSSTTLVNLTYYIIYLLYGISGLIAFGNIVFGGFEYMTGNSKKGGERIKNAIIGLVLVLASYIILQTISPDLTNFTVPSFSQALPQS
jgi:hypothetical protein